MKKKREKNPINLEKKIQKSQKSSEKSLEI